MKFCGHYHVSYHMFCWWCHSTLAHSYICSLFRGGVAQYLARLYLQILTNPTSNICSITYLFTISGWSRSIFAHIAIILANIDRPHLEYLLNHIFIHYFWVESLNICSYCSYISKYWPTPPRIFAHSHVCFRWSRSIFAHIGIELIAYLVLYYIIHAIVKYVIVIIIRIRIIMLSSSWETGVHISHSQKIART